MTGLSYFTPALPLQLNHSSEAHPPSSAPGPPASNSHHSCISWPGAADDDDDDDNYYYSYYESGIPSLFGADIHPLLRPAAAPLTAFITPSGLHLARHLPA